MTDTMMGDAALDMAVSACTPIVAAASAAAAHAFAASLHIVRASCPAFDGAIVRDRAETTLRMYAVARAAMTKYPCERAEKLAMAAGPPTEQKAVLRAAVDAWQIASDAGAPDASKYVDAYQKSLAGLNTLIAAADARH